MEPDNQSLKAPPALTLSHFEVTPLLEAWRRGEPKAPTSPDLGRTKVEAALSAAGARFPSLMIKSKIV